MSRSDMRVVFCLPGKEFSGRFLSCWTQLFSACKEHNIEVLFSQQSSSVVYYVRNLCLGGNNLSGVNQKPFQGKIDYDYLMWIDSDIFFQPEHFFALLRHNKEIVSGVYMMEGQKHVATVKEWDLDYFSKHGHFRFLTLEDLGKEKGLFEVDYTGFGWMLIKRGVFESLSYPWFQPMWEEVYVGGTLVRDFCSEDVSCCHRMKEKGYSIWVDPTIRVGHEKFVVL